MGAVAFHSADGEGFTAFVWKALYCGTIAATDLLLSVTKVGISIKPRLWDSQDLHQTLVFHSGKKSSPFVVLVVMEKSWKA